MEGTAYLQISHDDAAYLSSSWEIVDAICTLVADNAAHQGQWICEDLEQRRIASKPLHARDTSCAKAQRRVGRMRRQGMLPSSAVEDPFSHRMTSCRDYSLASCKKAKLDYIRARENAGRFYAGEVPQLPAKALKRPVSAPTRPEPSRRQLPCPAVWESVASENSEAAPETGPEVTAEPNAGRPHGPMPHSELRPSMVRYRGPEFRQAGLGIGERFASCPTLPGPGEYDMNYGSVSLWNENSCLPTEQRCAKFQTSAAHTMPRREEEPARRRLRQHPTAVPLTAKQCGKIDESGSPCLRLDKPMDPDWIAGGEQKGYDARSRLMAVFKSVHFGVKLKHQGNVDGGQQSLS